MFHIDLPVQLDAVRHALAHGGLRAALGLLNDRTAYRFTGIYRLDGEVMRAVQVFDRTGEARTWLRVVPLGRSFCRHVLAQGEFFTRNASTDQRLRAHPYAGLVEAYYGRLLHGRNGAPYGTLIHFDLNACDMPDGEAAFLRAVAPLFSDHLG